MPSISFDFSPTVIKKLLAENQSCERKRLDEGVEFRVRIAYPVTWYIVSVNKCPCRGFLIVAVTAVVWTAAMKMGLCVSWSA